MGVGGGGGPVVSAACLDQFIITVINNWNVVLSSLCRILLFWLWLAQWGLERYSVYTNMYMYSGYQ